MKNKKGQSLIDVVFSIGIVVLVLTGVVVLIVSTAKIKTLSMERQKAVELSQLLMEAKTAEIRASFDFWNNPPTGETQFVNYVDFDTDYFYNISWVDCNDNTCKAIFTVKWGNEQTLTVEKLFSKTGI